MIIIFGTLPAYASTISVTTTSDELNSNGRCSLREAVRNANAAGRPFSDCVAGSGDDVILLNNETYTLTIGGAENGASTGDLDISRRLIIAGGGATVVQATIGPSQASVGRVFDVAFNAALELRFLSVRNGNALTEDGGGIRTAGALKLEEVTVAGNRATQGGGVFQTGFRPMIINRSVISGNEATDSGGGVHVGNDAQITDTTIRDNVAEHFGGGLNAGGTTPPGNAITVSRCTFSGNIASAGGGVALDNDATVAMTNVTISGNALRTAVGGGGGIHYRGVGQVTIAHATIADNTTDSGSGVRVVPPVAGGAVGSLRIRGSILAGNTPQNCSGPITSQNFNLDGGTSCPFDGSDDVQNVDPLLGPLQDNGGRTETRRPAASSPAVGRIPFVSVIVFPMCSTGVNQDQRGIARVRFGGAGTCDIGAVER